MKSSTSIAVGSHDYKTLPIVPVKVKGRGSGELHNTEVELLIGQDVPEALRNPPKSGPVVVMGSMLRKPRLVGL